MDYYFSIFLAFFYYFTMGWITIGAILILGMYFKEWSNNGKLKGIFGHILALVVGLIVVTLTQLPHADI